MTWLLIGPKLQCLVKRAYQRTLDLKFGIYEDIKDLTSVQKFTVIIKTWSGQECKCNICKYLDDPYHYT